MNRRKRLVAIGSVILMACVFCAGCDSGEDPWVEAEITTFDTNGDKTSIQEFYYDDQGNKEKTIVKSLDDAGDVSADESFYVIFDEYDEEGNEIRSHSYSFTDEPMAYVEYDYDGKLLIKTKSYDLDGQLSSSSTLEYDENGNAIKENYTNYVIPGDESSKSSGHRTYKNEYDDGDNLIGQYCYNYYGDLESISKYEYDENGNLAVSKSYDANGERTGTAKWKWVRLSELKDN